MKFLTTIVCALAVVALASCGGSYLSEFPGDGVEGCQPGEIVAIDVEIDNGTPSSSGVASSKADFSYVTAAEDFDTQLDCPDAIPVIPQSVIDPTSLKIEDDNGNTMTSIIVKDSAAGCAGNEKSCIYFDKDPTSGHDRALGYIDCTAFATEVTEKSSTAVYLKANVEHDLSFDSLAPKDTIGYITVLGKEISGAAAFDNTAVTLVDQVTGGGLEFAVTASEIAAMAAAYPTKVNTEDLSFLAGQLWDDSFKSDRMADTFLYRKTIAEQATGVVKMTVPWQKDLIGIAQGSPIVGADKERMISNMCVEADSSLCGWGAGELDGVEAGL